MQKFTSWMYETVGRIRFFWATLGLFVVQSVWLACTAIYPLPFDEYFHVGVIQIYAKQWTPFIGQQPPGSGLYGDITREPSFLYHYLMSFPYRFFDLFTNNQAVLIVATRLINVLFVLGMIVLLRRLLLVWGMSRRLTHGVLLAFVCTPIIPFLAAQVNYDNLMLLLTPVFLLLATRLIASNQDLLRRSLLFGLVGSVTLLVKQTFLPLLIITGAYVAIVIWRRNGSKLLKAYQQSWRRTAKGISFGAICLGLVVSGGLVLERYGGNVVTYGTFRPACEVVQPRSHCEDFGPWYRDNVLNVQNRPAEPPYGNPLSFTQYWMTRMMRGFYAIFMHTPTQVVSDIEPFGPIQLKSLLPIPVIFGSFMLAIGMGAIVFQWKRLWTHQYLRFGLVIAGFYSATLWLFNYNSYLKLWKAEAIQARYTAPVLVIVFVLMAQALSWSVSSKKLKSGLLLLFVALYVWGGGVAGWLIRAEDTWRWQNPTVQSVNRTVQKTLNILVIH